jgi:carboxyl-terminal processing protease
MFFRPSKLQTIELTLTREAIKVETVRDAHVLADGIGYIQLTQFSERTGAEFKEALRRLQAGGIKALVLDLRNNPGGLLDAAVEVAASSSFTRRGARRTAGRNCAPDPRPAA